MIRFDLHPGDTLSFVIESIRRIGKLSRDTATIRPYINAVEINGAFYLAHYRELWALVEDDDEFELDEVSLEILNHVAALLVQWEMILVQQPIPPVPVTIRRMLSIVSHKDLANNRYSVNYPFDMWRFIEWKNKTGVKE